MIGGDSVSEKTYMVRMPEELHRQAKLQAVSEGIRINDLILKALSAYLKKKRGK